MTPNENFNMIVKKFILNEGLIAAIVVGYILGGGCISIGFMGYACETITDLRVCFFGIFILIITGAFNCFWYCLQKYDKMYGLFNNWESGCNVCQSLHSARQRNSIIDYKITLNKTFNEREHILAKGYPLYCPNCGRKMSSFNTSRYW